ncbi:MAG: TIGR03087 family PEP-CTERM/XrtA system glycosyltransferase [Planctomycetota bacterium]|jgi:sugar transferase (PEP-CTERM/EpsH1 system associated)
MKVLFLCQRIPYPPDRGDRITTHHFLRHYGEKGASIRIGCFAEEDADLSSAREIEKLGWEICAPRISRPLRKLASLRGLLTGSSLTLPFFSHSGLRRQIDSWIAADPPDLIHVYSSSMAQYVMDCPDPLRIMQFAELDSDKWRQYAERRSGFSRWIYSREARLLLAFERQVAKRFDVSFVVSPVEKELFEQAIPEVRPEVLPNGVDTAHFESAGEDRREAKTLIFTGVMDYEPNVEGILWFVRECWPEIRKQHPDARLLVVGSRPVASITALQDSPGIEVTGRVPETPPYFDRASIALAPIRLARGVQNKVLEAMSMSLPVVSTSQAAQGVGEAPGLLVADSVDAILAQVDELLANPARARELGRQAANFVREEYRWERMYEKLDAVLAASPRSETRSAP